MRGRIRGGIVFARSSLVGRYGLASFVCTWINFLGALLPLLEAAVELEEFRERGANNFPFCGLVSAGRFNVADVLDKFVQLTRVHVTLQGLESLDAHQRIVAVWLIVRSSVHNSSRPLVEIFAEGAVVLRRYLSCLFSASLVKPSL